MKNDIILTLFHSLAKIRDTGDLFFIILRIIKITVNVTVVLLLSTTAAALHRIVGREWTKVNNTMRKIRK